jgi:sigma-E factor negative regulatory protein RseC
METIGIIVTTEGQFAQVKTTRHVSCNRCGACGLGVTGSDVVVKANNVIGAKAGEQVILEMRTDHVMKAAFFGYMVPLIFFVIGIAAGHYLTHMINPEAQTALPAIIGGFGLLVLSYVFLRYYDRRASARGEYEAWVTGYVRD